MIEKLFPDLYVKSIYELPVEMLQNRGIKVLVFDIDNTISPYDLAEPDEETLELFEYFRKKGFKICLLSNNSKKRVTLFNRRLKAAAVYRAGKPGAKKLKAVLDKMGFKAKEAAVIGDQIFTDVLCGHNAGAFAVYSEPICQRDQLVTKVKRPIDGFVINAYKRRKGI